MKRRPTSGPVNPFTCEDWTELLNEIEKSYPDRVNLTEENIDPNSSYAKIIGLIGDAKNVLDVGCASGYLARLLSNNGCVVTGIDLNAQAVAEAAKYCARTLVADLDTERLSSIFPEERFDAVIFADVLEHLRDPWRVLDDARAVLHTDGVAITSIPNIAHGAIRLALVSGNFDYSEFGILDDTHLRFFTRRTLGDLFVRAGFLVERIDRTILPLFEPSELVPRLYEQSFAAPLVEQIREDEDYDTLQFVVRARALDDSARARQILRVFGAANNELLALREARRLQDDELLQTKVLLKQTHEELLRTQQAFADIERAPALLGEAKTELERARLDLEAKDRQIASLEERTSELKTLYKRSGDELFLARKQSVEIAADKRELERQLDDLKITLSLAYERIDAVTDQNGVIERFCTRLSSEEELSRTRAVAAERELHRILNVLADDFGRVPEIDEQVLTTLRACYLLLLAQEERTTATKMNRAIKRRSFGRRKLSRLSFGYRTFRAILSRARSRLRRLRSLSANSAPLG